MQGLCLDNLNVTMTNQPQEVGDWQQLSVLGSGAFGTVMLWCNRKKNDFVGEYLKIIKIKLIKLSILVGSYIVYFYFHIIVLGTKLFFF